MPLLPVDTAVVVSVGPLVDDTDFKALETAIAYDESGMSVDLFENSGIAITKTDLTLTSGGANDWTHKGNGVYEIEITAAQNNTEGSLWVVGVCDGVLPFESPAYTIVPEDVYNALVLGSDYLNVAVVEKANIDFGALEKASLNAATPASVVGAVGSVSGAVGSVTGTVGELAAQAKADVLSEVGDALAAIGLDHLISASVAGADVADDSIIAFIVSAAATADWDTFVNTTDSLEAIRDAGGGDATQAKQDEILEDIVDMKGTGFVKDTNSLVNLTPGSAVNLQIGGQEVVIT